MASEFISFAFTAGVISDNLLFRADLEKYDLGLRKALNWFIDYRGGISTRPGLEFIDHVEHKGEEVRLFPFKFNTALGNNILIVFSKDNIRFVQDGAYILESAVNLSGITNADSAVVTTASAHGYSDGDWIKIIDAGGMSELNSRTFRVNNSTSTTFELQVSSGDSYINYDSSSLGSYTSGGASRRIYTIYNPYTPADFELLDYNQDLDVIYFTHEDYFPRKLSRVSNTSWSLATIDFEGNTNSPDNVNLSPTETGSGASDTSGVAYTVTATNLEGQESIPTSFAIDETTVDFSSERGAMEISWDQVSDADFYTIYRTILVPSDGASVVKITYSQTFGYLGQSQAPYFIDANIVPDFTQLPPVRYNPFANGAVQKINITAAGSSYTKTGTTVSITSGTGSGFKGLPIVSGDGSGEIIGVRILNSGKNYTASDIVSFSDTGSGTGGTASLTVSSATGNNPKSNALIQQRRVYGGTLSLPMTLFASRPGDQDNFDFTAFQTSADSFEVSIDSSELTPIKFITPVSGGLFAFTESAVWRVSGVDGAVLAPSTARADIEYAGGIENLKPLQIKDTIVFLQFRGTRVLAFTPAQLRDTFDVREISLYSADFFNAENKLTSWAFSESPYNLIWSVREDGSLLSAAYVPEQNVYAWTEHNTKGKFTSVVSIFEGSTDTPYFVVERTINGKKTKYLERMADRESTMVEEVFALDSGVKTQDTFPAAKVTPTTGSGTGDTVKADSAVFSSSDVGKHIRLGGGRAIVTAVNSTNDILTVDWVIDMAEFKSQEPDVPIEAESGNWSLNETFTSFSGLDHLEGEKVSIFADGNVLPDQTVVDGTVTLSQGYSKVFIGLNYTAELHTLPLASREAVIEGRQKRLVATHARLSKSRGLEIGSRIGDGTEVQTYPLKERSTEKYGEPTRLQTRLARQQVSGSWEQDNSIVVKKTTASHATVLGLIIEAEIGND